jgi:hypoxia up-regulated 1
MLEAVATFSPHKSFRQILIWIYVCIVPILFRYSLRNLSSPIKTNLHFSLSRSGILSLDRADAVIEISEWVEVPKKNLTLDNSTTSSPNISVEADAKNASEESNDNLHVDGGVGNTSSSNVEENNTMDLGTERKLKKRTFRVPLKVQTSDCLKMSSW